MVGTEINKEQIDYYLIHKEFVYIKKRSLSNVWFINKILQYLENEKKNLEKNYYDRTLNMLKTIKTLEDANIKKQNARYRRSIFKSIK